MTKKNPFQESLIKIWDEKYKSKEGFSYTWTKADEANLIKFNKEMVHTYNEKHGMKINTEQNLKLFPKFLDFIFNINDDFINSQCSPSFYLSMINQIKRYYFNHNSQIIESWTYEELKKKISEYTHVDTVANEWRKYIKIDTGDSQGCFILKSDFDPQKHKKWLSEREAIKIRERNETNNKKVSEFMNNLAKGLSKKYGV